MIKKFEIRKLTNPMHLQYMDFVATLVSDNNPTALNVKPQYDLLSQKLTELKGLYMSVTAHPLSEQIQEADLLRDRYLTGIVKIVEGNVSHYSEITEASAVALKKNIQLYGKNITKNDLQTETAKIESLVNDWRTKSELTAAMGSLQLDGWIAELDKANNEFKSLYASRTNEYSQKTDENMQSKRLEVNAAYEDLSKFLNSYSVINSSNPAYGAVISGINTYVSQYATLTKRRKSHKTEKAEVK